MSELTILNSYQVTAFPDEKFVWPEITNKTKIAVLNQLEKSISIYDNSGIIKQFEDKFSKIQGTKHALLFSSGTSAIHSMYVAINLKEGDEVICPAYTFHATVTPIFTTGATPVLIDCDENGNIDPIEIEKKITKNTKAIIITHMWGVPCKMSLIKDIAKKNDLLLLEDFSHAHFAEYDGQIVGSFGNISACSIQGQKTLSGGEGGILVTNSDELYFKSLLFGHYNKRCVNELPQDYFLKKFAISGMGLKQRIHPLSAAIAYEQLDNIVDKIQTRREFAKKLISELDGVKGIKVPKIDDIVNPSWYAFTFEYLPKELNNLPKEYFYKALISEGCIDLDIPNSTCPLNLLPIFQEPETLYPKYKGKLSYSIGDFPKAEQFYTNLLKFPVWSKKNDIKKVNLYINAIKKVSEHSNDLVECLFGGKNMKNMDSTSQNKFLNELLVLAKNDEIKKIVVGAVIKNGDKVLLLERPNNDFMGGINELPSGNMESNETIKEALIREIKEETNLDLKNLIKYLGSFDYISSSGKKVRQFNFLVDVNENGKIKLTEHDNYVWAEKEHEAFAKVTENVREIIDKSKD